ncbi:hypothetical protein [Spirosoma sp. 209]|uniref:hypothetical protein n=1 Tax=Spirosoma sp. 209 TaxID=1955701 RepID=UPI00098D4D5C|nr:hypothetical protein [Spirosoma sp. 209]
MKDFLYDILIRPFLNGDSFGYFLGVCMWICVLLMLGLLLIGVLYVADNVGMPVKEGKGVVIGKRIAPAHTTTTWVMSGKVLVPVITRHPTVWYLDIQVDAQTDEMHVSEARYNKTPIGKTVQCKYVLGRLSEDLYIREIR